MLVIDTGGDSEFDIFIGEMREERIQDQIGQSKKTRDCRDPGRSAKISSPS
jgi:hypothetical protein